MRDANLPLLVKYLTFVMVCLWSFSFLEFLFNLARSVMLYISVLPVRMALYTSLAKAKSRFARKAKLRILKLGLNVLCSMRSLIGEISTWIEGDYKVCDSMFVSCTRESSNLSRCVASKFRKYKACDYQTSNAFVKFLICFHSFSFSFFSSLHWWWFSYL